MNLKSIAFNNIPDIVQFVLKQVKMDKDGEGIIKLISQVKEEGYYQTNTHHVLYDPNDIIKKIKKCKYHG